MQPEEVREFQSLHGTEKVTIDRNPVMPDDSICFGIEITRGTTTMSTSLYLDIKTARDLASYLIELADEIDPPVAYQEPGKPTPIYRDTKHNATD